MPNEMKIEGWKWKEKNKRKSLKCSTVLRRVNSIKNIHGFNVILINQFLNLNLPNRSIFVFQIVLNDSHLASSERKCFYSTVGFLPLNDKLNEESESRNGDALISSKIIKQFSNTMFSILVSLYLDSSKKIAF